MRVARSISVGIGPSLTPGETDAPLSRPVHQLWYPGQEKTPPETRQGRTEESYYALVARLRLKGESSLEAEFLPKIPGKMVIRRHKSKM